MAASDVQAPPTEAALALPDYLTDPDAVLKDKDAKWRYGRAPDYSKTRKVFEESKSPSLKYCQPFHTTSLLVIGRQDEEPSHYQRIPLSIRSRCKQV